MRSTQTQQLLLLLLLQVNKCRIYLLTQELNLTLTLMIPFGRRCLKGPPPLTADV